MSSASINPSAPAHKYEPDQKLLNDATIKLQEINNKLSSDAKNKGKKKALADISYFKPGESQKKTIVWRTMVQTLAIFSYASLFFAWTMPFLGSLTTYIVGSIAGALGLGLYHRAKKKEEQEKLQADSRKLARLLFFILDKITTHPSAVLQNGAIKKVIGDMGYNAENLINTAVQLHSEHLALFDAVNDAFKKFTDADYFRYIEGDSFDQGEGISSITVGLIDTAITEILTNVLTKSQKLDSNIKQQQGRIRRFAHQCFPFPKQSLQNTIISTMEFGGAILEVFSFATFLFGKTIWDVVLFVGTSLLSINPIIGPIIVVVAALAVISVLFSAAAHYAKYVNEQSSIDRPQIESQLRILQELANRTHTNHLETEVQNLKLQVQAQPQQTPHVDNESKHSDNNESKRLGNNDSRLGKQNALISSLVNNSAFSSLNSECKSSTSNTNQSITNNVPSITELAG